MIPVHFQGKPFNIRVIEVYAPTIKAKEAEAKPFYDGLQDLLEHQKKKNLLFIIVDWNAKAGSQEIPGVTGKLALEYIMKQGRGNRTFPKEHTGQSKHPLPTT